MVTKRSDDQMVFHDSIAIFLIIIVRDTLLEKCKGTADIALLVKAVNRGLEMRGKFPKVDV